MNYTPPIFEMLGLLALVSYLCAPAIRRLFEPEIQRAVLATRDLAEQHGISLSITAPPMDRLGRMPSSEGVETVVDLALQPGSTESYPGDDENLDDSVAVNELIAAVGTDPRVAVAPRRTETIAA